jgi:hypothetical protein
MRREGIREDLRCARSRAPRLTTSRRASRNTRPPPLGPRARPRPTATRQTTPPKTTQTWAEQIAAPRRRCRTSAARPSVRSTRSRSTATRSRREGRCGQGQARHRREHQGWSREPPGALAAGCGVEQPVRRGAEQLATSSARRARDFITTATAMGVPRLLLGVLRGSCSRSRTPRSSRSPRRRRRPGRPWRRSSAGAVGPRGQIRTDYIVNQITRISKINAGSAGTQTGNHGTGADGTTVPKTGLPYADRHLYLLADGERVTSNRHGQADKADLRFGHQRGATGRLMAVERPACRSPHRSASTSTTATSIKRRLRPVRGRRSTGDRRARATRSARDSLMGSITVEPDRRPVLVQRRGSAFSRQYAPGSIGAANATLQQQIRDARDTTALEKQLRARGVSGAALQDLIQNGGVSALRSVRCGIERGPPDLPEPLRPADVGGRTAASTGADVLGMTSAVNKTTSEVRVLTAEVRGLKKQIAVSTRTLRRLGRSTPRPPGMRS